MFSFFVQTSLYNKKKQLFWHFIIINTSFFLDFFRILIGLNPKNKVYMYINYLARLYAYCLLSCTQLNEPGSWRGWWDEGPASSKISLTSDEVESSSVWYHYDHLTASSDCPLFGLCIQTGSEGQDVMWGMFSAYKDNNPVEVAMVKITRTSHHQISSIPSLLATNDLLPGSLSQLGSRGVEGLRVDKRVWVGDVGVEGWNGRVRET